MGSPPKSRTYIRKSKTGPQNCDEWVVRYDNGVCDIALCGCPGRWEAEVVKQCISEALSSPNKSVRLRRMEKELREEG